MDSCREKITDAARQGAIAPDGWVAKEAGWPPKPGSMQPWHVIAQTGPQQTSLQLLDV